MLVFSVFFVSVLFCGTHVVLLAIISFIANFPDFPANTQLVESIIRVKSQLPDITEPDFGLLDQLLRLEVLSLRQYTKIRSLDKTAFERNDAVLDLLVSEKHCSKFLTALQKTDQQHVVNFITRNKGTLDFTALRCCVC